MSFRTDVKPILDTHCVSCHACFDAPDQLDLRNRKGIERGAKSVDPYAPRMEIVPNTLITNSPKNVDQWRKLGFYSVTDGGKQSIMGRMLQLAHDNPLQANAKLPSELDGRLDSLQRKNIGPNAIEFDAYVKEHSHEGMPFAVAGLDGKDYDTMMAWLDQGAQFDQVALKPTPTEQKKIADWEAFLNAPDDRSREVARYIFEHYNTGFLYFEPGTDHFFSIIRSTTPSGQDPVPVDNVRRATSPVDGPFYYRMMLVDQTPCVKQHNNLLDASGDRLERLKQIFYEQDWKVDKLPGYSLAEQDDPLNTFAAIPAKARYKFILMDSVYHIETISWSGSCRTGLIVSAVQERFWVFFENPETSLYVNDPAYRAALAPYTTIGDATSDDFLAVMSKVIAYKRTRDKAIEAAIAQRQGDGNNTRIEDIWAGDKPGDVPVVTPIRHDDNTWTIGGAVGDYPKTAWVVDLAQIERLLYQGVMSFDLFEQIGPQLIGRDSFGLMRRDSELNFLRFLPPATRAAVHASWYPILAEKDTQFLDAGPFAVAPSFTVPAQIEYKTDDPYHELLTMLLKRVGGIATIADPINRPQPGDPQPDPVTKAWQSIVKPGALGVPSQHAIHGL